MESLKFTREEKEVLSSALSNEIIRLSSLIDRFGLVNDKTIYFIEDINKYQKLLQKIRESYKHD